jgi:hypothetical protein
MKSILSALAVALLAAGSAHAVETPMTASLSVRVGTFDAITFTGSGTADTVPGGDVTLAGEQLTAGFVSRLENPLLGIIAGLSVCAPGYPDQTPMPLPPGAGESVASCAPLDDGALDALTYTEATGNATGGLLAAAYLSGNTDPSLSAVAIPLNIIGVGGQATFLVLGSASTLAGNPWTTGDVTVTGGLNSGDIGDDPFCTAAATPFPCCTGAGLGRCDQFNSTGADSRDPGTGLGQLKLVTTALATLGALGTVPTLAELTINLPEPASAAAGLAAIGALALLARARRS